MATVRRVLFGLPVIVLVILGVLVLMPWLATCGGHDEAVTELLLRCPRAKELIGDDAHPARLGCACGSTETSGGTGQASWSMPFTGERGRGTVSFDAEKHGGEWTVLRAQLEVGDETIDLVACGGGGGARRTARGAEPGLVQTNADGATAAFDGKVIRSTHPAIGKDTTCAGTLQRERGATTAKLTVRCKAGAEEMTIYDGSGAFTLDVRDPGRRDDDRTEYEDKQTHDQDGTPGCRMSSAGTQGTLTIWDTTPAFELVVAL